MDDSDCMTIGTRAGRLKAIFRLPSTIYGNTVQWPGSSKDTLAYVEWYTRFTPAADKYHKMYSLSIPPMRTDGTRQGAIIPLSQIRQACHLIPHFDHHLTIPRTWTTDTVLDSSTHFWLNNWSSLYAYQTLW